MSDKFSESTRALSRRGFFGGAIAGAAGMLAAPQPVWADDDNRVSDPFIVLLKGLYRPAPEVPDLGLSGVDLGNVSYVTTKIYPVFGVPGGGDQGNAIGQFYVSLTNPVCMYDLPGGALAMSFASGPVYGDVGFNSFVPFSDNHGGLYLEGTFELTVVDSTGIYRAFKGGHNHMVDRFHQLANGSLDEFCFCNISRYQFP